MPESYKVTLLVPLTDNEGKSFDPRTWIWWKDELMALVRGYTDMGIVNGWWQDYVDENQALVIIVSTMDEVRAIRNLLVRARHRFKQEAMYFEYHPVVFEEVR